MTMSATTAVFIPNEYFSRSKWIIWTFDAVPDNLQNPTTTTKSKGKGRSFGLTDNGSEDKDKPDQKPDQPTSSLSDTLVGTTPTPAQEPTSPISGPSKPKEEPITDNDVSFHSDKGEEPRRDPTPPPPPPPNPRAMETAPVPTPHVSSSIIRDLPEFKGKWKEAHPFIENIKIFFLLNPLQIDNDRKKILVALHKISDGAEQWKQNKLEELKNSTATTINGVTHLALFDDWNTFRTSFLENWGEIDPAGNASTKLIQLQQRPHFKGKKQMWLTNYVNQFKELIKKAGISGEAALHMFRNGLTMDEFEKAMLTQPTSLTRWYDATIRLDNIWTCTSANSPHSGNGQSSHQHDEWAMQVDHLLINDELVIRSMSTEKREHYIKEGLCFICRQKGHMSGVPKEETIII